MEIKKLIEMAIEAREFAYVPYSNFKVGSAIETSTGEVYTGCNIENAAFTPTNCAERTAIFKAVSEGHREIVKIVVVGSGDNTFPCGVCRQVMMEFAENAEIIIANSTEDYKVYSLKDILPHGFGPRDL